MTTIEGEEGETIEFYKIQLMEKDREISDFDTKIKKFQFKHNRQLKEIKLSQERAKALLKDEKAKVDKLAKQAKQNQEQNSLLQLRLAQLKDEKEKEVSEVRLQYNSIKEEVRTYQRILPTHTFLTEEGLSIGQLPTYEDLFVNLKEKMTQLQQLNSKFQQFRQKSEESLKTSQQTQEMLEKKKIQVENNLNQVFPKMIEYEHQISDLRFSNEQYENIINSVREQLQRQRSSKLQLQDAISEYQSKMDQLGHSFANEIHNKQEEIRQSFEEETERYQQQIKSLSSRIEIKDNMYISQIAILQQQIHLLQGKVQNDREKYDEEISWAKESLQDTKRQLQRSRKENTQLSDKIQESIKNLVQMNHFKEQLQQQVKLEEKKFEQSIAMYQLKIKEINQISEKKIISLENQYQNLQQEISKVKDDLAKTLEQKQNLEEIIEELRNRFTENSTKNSLDIPYNEMQFDQKFRKRSTEFDEETILVQIKQLTRQRQKTIDLTKKTEQMETENNFYKNQLDILRKQYESKIDTLNKLELELQQKSHQQKKLKEEFYEVERLYTAEVSISKVNREQISKLTQEKEKINLQLQAVKQLKIKQQQQQKRLIEQSVKLKQQLFINKQKLCDKSKAFSELQLSSNNIIIKQNLLRTKNDSLQIEIRLMAVQSKKDKDSLKSLKDELKELKQSSSLLEKYMKQVKQLNALIEVIKQQKDKAKNQFQNKQKSYLVQISSLKNEKGVEEKLNSKITVLNQSIKQIQEQKNNLNIKISQLVKETEGNRKEIEKLQRQNIQKDRQNEIVSQSLDRQRRERTLRSVPSLQSLQGEQQLAEEQTFNDIYSTITRKEGEINILQREISDLKEQLQSLKQSHLVKFEAMEAEQNDYIQTIIAMKVKCAESEMRASQKEYLYSQLKKKMVAMAKG